MVFYCCLSGVLCPFACPSELIDTLFPSWFLVFPVFGLTLNMLKPSTTTAADGKFFVIFPFIFMQNNVWYFMGIILFGLTVKNFQMSSAAHFLCPFKSEWKRVDPDQLASNTIWSLTYEASCAGSTIFKRLYFWLQHDKNNMSFSFSQ